MNYSMRNILFHAACTYAECHNCPLNPKCESASDAELLAAARENYVRQRWSVENFISYDRIMKRQHGDSWKRFLFGAKVV